MAEKEIGAVSVYFSHVEVAAIKLSGKLKVGDRIIERDGVKINTAGDFQSMPLIRIGQQVVYKILRDGQQIIVTLKAVPIKVVHPTF